MRLITQAECDHLDKLGLVDLLVKHRSGRDWQDDKTGYVWGVKCTPSHGDDYGVWVFKPEEAWQVITMHRNLRQEA